MAKKIKRVSGHGLQYRDRQKGTSVYWIAPANSNFNPRTMNLTKWIEFPDDLIRIAEEYNNEVKKEARGLSRANSEGTLGFLFKKYEYDESSTFFELSERSQDVYSYYLQKLKKQLSTQRIDTIISGDLMKWFNEWSSNREKLAAGKFHLAVLRAAVTFGISERVPGCIELKEVIRATSRRFPSPSPRTQTITADEVIALRKQAHAEGLPDMALAYAIVYETFLRLYDCHQELDWSHIDEDLVLRYTPTKTKKKTNIRVLFNLNSAPMVMEELTEKLKNGKPESGPVVLSNKNGKRFKAADFAYHFRKHRDIIGMDNSIWARDLRASGITEARNFGSSTEDVRKLAGHSTSVTTSTIYDRAALASAERIAKLRVESRATNTSV